MMQQMLVGLGGGGGVGSATGGIYHYDPGTGKAYHVFLVGKHKLTVDSDINNGKLLIVGGGGGGGAHHGGGGGAGGALYHSSLSLSAGDYNVDIGKGGAGAIHGHGPANGTATYGENGHDSYLGPPSTPQGYTAYGGGGAFPLGRNGGSGITPLYYDNAPSTCNPYQGGGLPGGCGGGTGDEPGRPGGAATQTPMNGATGYGYAGQNATGPPTYNAGGGGGTGETSSTEGKGGNGRAFSNFPAALFSPFMPAAWTSEVAPQGYFGGGGGRGSEGNAATEQPGGVGGGGDGASGSNPGTVGNPGTEHTGGGGGGSSGFYADGGDGGPGIAILSYDADAPEESAGLMTVSTTANGTFINGNYTFYTFTSTGTFTVTQAAPDIRHPDGRPGNYVSIVTVGGGGSGGHHHGAGGGGGGCVYATGPGGDGVIDLRPAAGNGAITVKIGAGGPGGQGGNATNPGIPGQASRFGASSDPYYVIAHGGGGGGSHETPNFRSSGSRPYGFMSSWLTDDTAPPSYITTANGWWNPNVPGGSNDNGAGPRSGGSGGGAPWSMSRNPYVTNGTVPYSNGCDGPSPFPHYYGESGGFGTQKLAPGVSGFYGYGSPGGGRHDYPASINYGYGGGGSDYAGKREFFSNRPDNKQGSPARNVPNNFYGPGHPYYNTQHRLGAGGGGQHQHGPTAPGGDARPGSGGAGGSGGNASGYGNGGGGNRYWPDTSGSGSSGIMIIKVRSS
tara:strand:+ start:595 stop:2781 length:2187 start_codon:yes stop_codon:yes gene_type:complete